MQLDLVRKSLIAHEGMKLAMYTCTAGKPTIGVGHNLERPISERAAKVILDDDIADCIIDLDKSFKGWRDHDDARQNVLVEMCFNIGVNGLKKFVKMWQALENKDYQAASDEMLQSAWRTQVGKRAVTLAQAMRGD